MCKGLPVGIFGRVQETFSATLIFLDFLEMDTLENWQSRQTQKNLKPANRKA
jgi:hypothetical protein